MDKILKFIKIPSKKTIAVYAVSASVIAILFLALYFTVGQTLAGFVNDVDSFKLWLDSYKGLSSVIFVMIRAFQTVIKIIPAEPLEIASGYAFGTFSGAFLCSLGSFLGSLVIVLLSRTLGKGFVETFINEKEFNKLKLLSDSKNQRLFLAIFYLIPGTPKDILTYIFATTKSNLVEFFVITTICRIPSIITSTVCGSQIEKHNIKLAIAIFIATAVITLVSTVIYKRIEKRKVSNCI